MSQQAPKSPNPFDPVEEAQISQMVYEGGPDSKPNDTHSAKPSQPNTAQDYGDVADSVNKALETFKRLNEGGDAPTVEVQTDGHHISASWTKPKKWF